MAWCCSKTHSITCSSLGSNLDQSTDHNPFPRIVRLLLWFCCFRRPPDSFLWVFVERNLCYLKIPDQGFLTYQSPQQLILLTPEQTTLRQSASDLHLEEQDSPAPSGRRDRDTLLRSATNHVVWEVFTLRLDMWFSQTVIKNSR